MRVTRGRAVPETVHRLQSMGRLDAASPPGKPSSTKRLKVVRGRRLIHRRAGGRDARGAAAGRRSPTRARTHCARGARAPAAAPRGQPGCAQQAHRRIALAPGDWAAPARSPKVPVLTSPPRRAITTHALLFEGSQVVQAAGSVRVWGGQRRRVLGCTGIRLALNPRVLAPAHRRQAEGRD